ncbi:MAG: acyl-CoA dehydrogenase [Dehalococcoidia bacterium]|nr:acyl-CoA dehydrogenase [Dehalococcoidia bacterium]
MDFKDSPAEAAFREEVVAFIEKEAPKRGRDRIMGDFDGLVNLTDWWKKLASRGWIAPAWPKEYGGASMTTIEQFIFNMEMARYRAPRPMHMIMGLGMAGPTIITLGTEQQKQKYLTGMLSGEDIWCQGYSEPQAGSDLASLQTRAVRDGDDWLINGQKIWTSLAHMAKYMIMLARTDPDAPKHKGITYFIVDMKAPGVEVRPLINMTGGHEFNEVFFDNVRVTPDNIIGEVNRGWYGAVTTLDFERSSVGSAVGIQQTVEDILRFAREQDNFSRLKHNPSLRYELADRAVEAEIAILMSYHIAGMQYRGLIPNYEASMCKLYSTELNQRVARSQMHVAGLYGQLGAVGNPPALLAVNGRYNYNYLRTVAATIEGGTSEVQRNIIATRGLGLPRD